MIMKTSEENVKKERKPHGAIFWLIWTLVVGSIFGLCVGAVATFEEEYHGYEQSLLKHRYQEYPNEDYLMFQ